jgi:hypothetical protein
VGPQRLHGVQEGDGPQGAQQPGGTAGRGGCERGQHVAIRLETRRAGGWGWLEGFLQWEGFLLTEVRC